MQLENKYSVSETQVCCSLIVKAILELHLPLFNVHHIQWNWEMYNKETECDILLKAQSWYATVFTTCQLIIELNSKPRYHLLSHSLSQSVFISVMKQNGATLLSTSFLSSRKMSKTPETFRPIVFVFKRKVCYKHERICFHFSFLHDRLKCPLLIIFCQTRGSEGGYSCTVFCFEKLLYWKRLIF